MAYFPQPFPVLFQQEGYQSGSWVSDLITASDTTNISFVVEEASGSVEYGVFDNDNTVLLAYNRASDGSNVINITSYLVDSDYRVGFRLYGLPSNPPKVTSFRATSSGAEDVLQTINLGSDIELDTTLFTRAYVLPTGSLAWLVEGSVSADGGASWTPVPNYGLEFDITSTTGSEPMIRLASTLGSSTIQRLTAYFHTADVD